MTKASEVPGRWPTHPLTVQQTAEVGELLCKLYQRVPVAEVVQMLSILADCGHGGAQTIVERYRQRQRKETDQLRRDAEES